jgi:transposase
MSKRKSVEVSEQGRRRYTAEFKAEAVQMLLDGHTAASVCERLGLSGVNLLYLWKWKLLAQGGPAAVGLEARVRQLEAELRRVERDRELARVIEEVFWRHRRWHNSQPLLF